MQFCLLPSYVYIHIYIYIYIYIYILITFPNGESKVFTLLLLQEIIAVAMNFLLKSRI